MEYSRSEEACENLARGAEAELDSHRPEGETCDEHFKWESGRRHWLSGEVQVRFATVIGSGERGSATEVAPCNLMVTFGREMHVREASLQMEDMDGMQLNGRDNLGILQSCHIRFADVELR
ncbi:F-box protein [Sesbania bispinosa]|nr:F-box protein [Sesbania bispinosa]